MIRQLIAIALAAFALGAAAATEVNRATQAELESVKGIGPALSARIVEARKTGDFKSWDDLAGRVGGIGAGNAARLSQAGLTVQGGSFQGPAPAKTAKARKSEKAPKADG